MTAAARIQAREASRQLGLSLRAVQAMAARGQIPGAAKLGSTWTFDPIKLRRWIRAREQECQATSISAAGFGMPAFKLTGATSGNPYRRMIEKRRSAG